MALVEQWSVSLGEATPTVICRWGDTHVFVAYTNGLMEIRSLADGEITAQGLSPFINGYSSGGDPIQRVGYCREGVGVLIGSPPFGSSTPVLSTIRVDLGKGLLFPQEPQSMPLGYDASVGRDVQQTGYLDTMRDGFRMDPPNVSVGELGTCPTGGLMLQYSYRSTNSPRFRLLSPGVWAGWFDVADNGEVTWTRIAGEIAERPTQDKLDVYGDSYQNDYLAPRANLRWVEGQIFRDIRHVYDKAKPVPVSVTRLVEGYGNEFLYQFGLHYGDADGTIVSTYKYEVTNS